MATTTTTAKKFTSESMISVLRKEGFRVFIRHVRPKEDLYNHPREGSTEVRLEKGPRAFSGKSFCHPNDNYCKETGRKLAIRKALDSMRETDPELRKTIREIFKTMNPSS